jgi:hypothetical protein
MALNILEVAKKLGWEYMKMSVHLPLPKALKTAFLPLLARNCFLDQAILPFISSV